MSVSVKPFAQRFKIASTESEDSIIANWNVSEKFPSNCNDYWHSNVTHIRRESERNVEQHIDCDNHKTMNYSWDQNVIDFILSTHFVVVRQWKTTITHISPCANRPNEPSNSGKQNKMGKSIGIQYQIKTHTHTQHEKSLTCILNA